MKALAFGCAALLLISCEDRNEPAGQGNVQFELTDAPADDANVKSVIVTVADIKVDGKSIGGVTKTTLDLKAFTEGNTKVLATATQFDARAYSNVTLVLDLNNDANGASPGCYVETYDGMRHQLKETADGMTEVTVSKSYEVASNTTTRIVLDFDIRKGITYRSNGSNEYRFVGDRDLNSSIRLLVREKTGVIKGLFNENSPAPSDKVIVYAYKKGTFSASTETQPQGENQTYFINAAASSEVHSGMRGKEFTLAFLENGDYELYFASYGQTPSGRSSFKGVLQAEMTVGGSEGNKITVEAGATVSISALVRDIL